LQLAFERTNQPEVGEVSVILRRRAWYSYQATPKRLLDVVLAILVFVATLPIWLVIAVAIKLDSDGPFIFVQERVGLRGRSFRIYKFRSMTNGSEKRKEELSHLNEVDGPVFKVRADPRVTRVGRLLRQTRLDELPQLINVLRGEMSMVGPRPATPDEVAQYRPNDLIRLAVKPGLTCWWQARGRSTLDFDTWMDFDREYVYGLSFWVDLQILVRTVGVFKGARGTGASSAE
jgi:lipopolysaccharide/colanic/teichoic acid biosynthesis glycosyltransferase